MNGADFEDVKSRRALPNRLLHAAREEELSFMSKIHLYDEVPLEECLGGDGKGPVSTKFVDLNKGTDNELDIWCRLVAYDWNPRSKNVKRP